VNGVIWESAEEIPSGKVGTLGRFTRLPATAGKRQEGSECRVGRN
jgi:hypothetical protein